MARHFSCDLTGEPIADPAEVNFLGHVLKREYGPKGAARVKKYLADLDDLHTEIAKQWTEGKKALRDAIKEEYPEGLLPDESEEDPPEE